jgi:hypothetical protein
MNDGARPDDATPSPTISSARLQREWALCALAAASARFVPVPLVDDLIRERAVRTAVARTWRAHGRPHAPEVIDILADETGGFWHSVRGAALKLPVTLALFPVRKVMRWVTAVRGVSRDLAEVLLLARGVDRCLDAGWFTTTDQGELQRQARLVRQAHERTVATADLRVLEHALAGALGQMRGLPKQAAGFARHVFGRDAPDPVEKVAEGKPVETDRPTVAEGADRVQAVLERPDVTGLLAALDQRFDAALAEARPS